MEVEQQIEKKFLEVKTLMIIIFEAVKDGQDKPVLEPLSRDLALAIYHIKGFIKESELAKPKLFLLNQEIEQLEEEILEQEKIITKIEEFEE